MNETGMRLPAVRRDAADGADRVLSTVPDGDGDLTHALAAPGPRLYVDLASGLPRLQRVVRDDAPPVLVAGRGDPGAAALPALQREFALRHVLSPDWAAVPLALVPHDDGAWLLLQDPGGEPPRAVDAADFVPLALSLARAVAAMHDAGLLHLSLRRDRFLVDAAGHVRLTGFGQALRDRDDGPRQPDARRVWDDASLRCMAPELGGRMHLRVDRRADLYALGCVLYELLTGAPPFDGDAAALVHAHATRLPSPPAGVPAPVARIVLRLLEKSPERRHPDAATLLADLQRCDPHASGASHDGDTAVRRLRDAWVAHGRDDELQRLADLCRSVRTTGRLRCAWVSGRSGIGKSRVLDELVQRLAPTGPLLVARSKMDEGARARPYGALVRAVEPLLQFLLGGDDDEFARWRERLGAALGPLGPTLPVLLPTLAPLLGVAAAHVAPHDIVPTREREQVLQGFARLLAALGTPERPLVLLLDDLQWADVGTRQVLERVRARHADAALLLVGTFRTDAAGPPDLPPGADAVHLPLDTLGDVALRGLLARVLALPVAVGGDLAAIVARKTDATPLLVQQFVERLAADGVLAPDDGADSWRCDVARAAAHPGIGSVADLLAHKLDALPPDARTLLQVLACLGVQAPAHTLARAADVAAPDVDRHLDLAAAAGLVVRHDADWRFVHDRFRDGVLALVPTAERAPLHLQIARRLPVDDTDPFPVATLTQQVAALVLDPAERRRFAEVNLAAGRLAKSASAPHSALGFFRAALVFLGESDDSAVGVAARMLCGEAEFMTGELEQADLRLSALESAAGNGIAGADLVRLRAALYTALGRFDRALEVGLAFLRRSGIALPHRPDATDVDAEHARLQVWLDRHGVAALHDLPVAVDPLHRAVVDIFADLIPPAMYTDHHLADLILLRMVSLAIAHGHTDASADGYACMGLVFGDRYGDHAATRAFGALALHLVDTCGLARYRGRVYMTVGTLVVPWTAPARTARPHIRRAYDAAVAAADHTFALYCGRNEATGMLFAGEALDEVRERVERSLVQARDAKFQLVVDALESQSALLDALQGEPEAAMPRMTLPAVEASPSTLVTFAHWVYRLQVACLFGDGPAAADALARAEACATCGRAFAESGDLPFYGALALLALPSRDAVQQVAVARHLAQLSDWARTCPDNFAARRDLVQAEVSRVAGDRLAAGDAYVRALAHARRHGFTQVEALAAERAAGFHAAHGDEVSARAHLRHARGAWQRWGATARVHALLALHPELVDDAAGVAGRLQTLDVQAVLRVSSALASDIVPERLVETLLRTALESAGATGGSLVLRRQDAWQVAARARVADGAIVVVHGAAPFSHDVLPVPLVQAVVRAREGMVVHDAPESAAWGQDPYVRRERPRAMLCVPLMRYAALVGALYLENTLVARAFTPAKAALLEALASQAGFALENARLYEDLVEQNAQRARAEEQLRHALADLERASRLKAMGELVASIVHEIGQPIAAVDTSARAGLRWLDRATPELGEARDMLAHICASATRARAIIDGLRAKARQAEPQFSQVDLGDTLREAVTLTAGTLDALHVRLEVDGLDADVFVRGDRVQLQQVAINLLMNGAEAMAETPVASRVLRLTCRDTGAGTVRVSVEDRGPGIPQAISAQLLQPLFTTKAKGMGMGLPICKSILDAHGGTLQWVSHEAGGACLSFELPRC